MTFTKRDYILADICYYAFSSIGLAMMVWYSFKNFSPLDFCFGFILMLMGQHIDSIMECAKLKEELKSFGVR